VPAIQLESVAKHWGDARALDAISFTAEPGAFVVLLGPSGCGKSTTLRLIAGLDSPTAGTIRINGRDVTALPPAGRGLSMVFQSYALFPHLTVAENIQFGLKVRKVAPGERAARLKRVADLLGLSALLERKPGQLSGGQQQRVALGRAIIAEAPVCLMDEPLSNLDAQLRGEMRREIRALQQRLGITMVYVTHDQTEAMTMADQVVLLKDGRIEQDGTPEDLYARPATAFTASFIGTPPMNLLKIARHGDGWTRDDRALIGVRPEDVTIVASGGLAARVESIEYLGSDSLIALTAFGEPLQVRVPRHATVRPGEELRLSWDTGSQHAFDNQTGARLTAPAGHH
jgi:sn-glycerol 3-phosphate transport system ATP-binding protein